VHIAIRMASVNVVLIQSVIFVAKFGLFKGNFKVFIAIDNALLTFSKGKLI
jgi:hypothetical protein